MSKTKILDVFPQYLMGNCEQGSTNAFAQLEMPTGLAAVSAVSMMEGGGKDEMLVCEVLGVEVQNPYWADNDDRIYWSFDTISRTAPTNNGTRGFITGYDATFHFVTSGAETKDRFIKNDLTLGGLGYLVAAPNIFFHIQSVGLSQAFTFHVRVYYRYVRVSFFEFYQLQRSQTIFD